MAVRTREELLKIVRDYVKDNTDDATLQLLEDVDDTFKDFADKQKDETDWKAKFEENDKEWRTKYKERFMSGGDDEKKDVNPTPADEKKEEDEDEKETFNDLFSEERK